MPIDSNKYKNIIFDLGNVILNIDYLLAANAFKELGLNTKFYQASTSELYGKVAEIPQNEKTPFYPVVPMLQRSFMLIGLQLIIEKHMDSLREMVFYLIMSLQEEVKLL